MEMSFRWYGKTDSIPLEYIRQIPGMKGIVSAIYDVPVGEVWPLEKIQALKKQLKMQVCELQLSKVFLYTKILKWDFLQEINILKTIKHFK